MKVGDLVSAENAQVKGVVVPAPRVIEGWQRDCVWVLIFHTPDGAFIGEAHPWQAAGLTVVSEVKPSFERRSPMP